MEGEATFSILGITFSLTTIVSTLVVCCIVFFACFFCARNLQMKPKGKQNALEWVIDFTNGIVKSSIPGKEGRKYGLLIFTLFLFIFVSNQIGLAFQVSIHDVSYFKSPTADPINALSLALFVILLTHLFSVQKKGFKGYFKSFVTPVAFLAPINILEEFTNLLTLGLRLYGNIFAGEVLLSLIASLGSSIGPVGYILGLPLEVIWQGFSMFIGSIQAFVFTTLATVYIAHKLEVE